MQPTMLEVLSTVHLSRLQGLLMFSTVSGSNGHTVPKSADLAWPNGWQGGKGYSEPLRTTLTADVEQAVRRPISFRFLGCKRRGQVGRRRLSLADGCEQQVLCVSYLHLLQRFV